MSEVEAFRCFNLSDDILSKKYPSVAERYYSKKYRIGIKQDGDDMCVLVHTNKVCCIVTLAPSHPLLRDKQEIVSVDYQIGAETNRLDNKVSGKSKKGAQWLHETSRLCTVRCKDGSVYTLYSALSGRLVEVNERLVHNPQLLSNLPDSEGFLAVVLVRLQDQDKTIHTLLSPEQYQESIQNRTDCTPSETREDEKQVTDDGMKVDQSDENSGT